TSATPTSPVRRAQASAMCTAAASCRTCRSGSLASSAASNTGMTWLPDSVNTWRVPARTSARATRSAPRVFTRLLSRSGGQHSGDRRARALPAPVDLAPHRVADAAIGPDEITRRQDARLPAFRNTRIAVQQDRKLHRHLLLESPDARFGFGEVHRQH